MSSPQTRTEQARSVADSQRAWLDLVTAQTGLTLSEVARRAGMTASTLTRFRNKPDHTGSLSAATLARIAEATGVAAPHDLGGALALPLPRAVAPRGLREAEAALYQPEDAAHDPFDAAVAASLAGRRNAFAYELRSSALEYEQARPGDVLIVLMGATAQDGDLVCAQIYDWHNPGGTQTVWRRYEAPYLVAAGPVEAARKPRLVDNEGVAVSGVIETILRRIRNRV